MDYRLKKFLAGIKSFILPVAMIVLWTLVLKRPPLPDTTDTDNVLQTVLEWYAGNMKWLCEAVFFLICFCSIVSGLYKRKMMDKEGD